MSEIAPQQDPQPVVAAAGPLRVGVVGCRGMGTHHGKAMAALDEFAVVGGCDINPQTLAEFCAAVPSARPFSDYGQMLAEARPDVVVVATNNVQHASMTIRAAEAGVRGVYCEKPMAANYGEAKAMVAACKAHGTALAVNHQRRTYPVFRTMRRLIEAGAIGEVQLIIGSGGGDVLSDGTHFVDTARHLAGDSDAKWVFAQIYRDPPKPEEPRAMGFTTSGGWRYGHPVETGSFSVFEFANGMRAEYHGGKLSMHMRWYQHYEVIGSKGRLIRANDQADPPLLIQDESGGPRPVPIEPADATLGHAQAMSEIFRGFAKMIHEGAPHPLSGESALKDQEIVMAIYESARLRKRIDLPLMQDRFPLEIMVENGQL